METHKMYIYAHTCSAERICSQILIMLREKDKTLFSNTQLGKAEASKKIKALEIYRGCMRAMLSSPAYPFLQGWKHFCILLFGEFLCNEDREHGEQPAALRESLISSSQGQVELPREQSRDAEGSTGSCR